MAITTAVDRQRREGVLVDHPMVASVTIPKGALCIVVTASGHVESATDKASCTWGGIADETKTNGSTAGAASIRLWKKGVFRIALQEGNAAQTDVGAVVCVYDNDRVCRYGTSSNDIPVGRVVAYESATYVWVDLNWSPTAQTS